LADKVREIEQALQKSKDLQTKTTQQIASDQEVIAFLDSRVQELELAERTLTAEKKSISDQLISEQIRNEKKITVLSDMLQYERERADRERARLEGNS
jgi:FKBP-type peptidyl-prolyl cis-trans isomerase